MGLFGGGNSSRTRGREPEVRWGNPGATVLLGGTAKLDRAALQAALVAGWPAEQPTVSTLLGAGLAGTGGKEPDACTVVIGGTRIRCLKIDAPAPGLEGVIQTSRADRDALPSALGGQRAHLICFAEAPPADGPRATAHLLRIAVALEPQGALGVIQTDAQQCHTIATLRQHLDPQHLPELLGESFPDAWCNVIPFHGQGGSWVTSKGFAVAGVPDVTIWTRNAQELRAATGFIPGFFRYLHGGAKLAHGHTIQMEGGRSYRVGPVTEFRDYLCGNGETLALTPV